MDADLLVPQDDVSLADGAIAPWRGRHRMTYYQRLLGAVAQAHGIDMDKPFKDLTKKQKDLVLNGGPKAAYTIRYENRFEYSALIPLLKQWYQRRVLRKDNNLSFKNLNDDLVFVNIVKLSRHLGVFVPLRPFFRVILIKY